jgi:RNA polymerase sigma-70 factor (ECF subfamily)
MTPISLQNEPQFSRLAQQLCAGDTTTETLVVRRFAVRLMALARRQLGPRLRQKSGVDDVVQSTFRTFFRRLRNGEFDLKSWDVLWSLLVVMTVRKCASRRKHFFAARRDIRRESPLMGDGQQRGVPNRDPRPEEGAAFIELVEQLLLGLSDGEREITLLRVQGFSIDEICQTVGRSERTVRRVMARVRRRAARLANGDEAE